MAEEFKPITLNTQEECDNFMKDRISRVEKNMKGMSQKKNIKAFLIN